LIAANLAALRFAKRFVDSIFGKERVPEIVEGFEMSAEYPQSPFMRVLHGVANLKTGQKETLVLRPCTEPFWNECIKTVDTPGRSRVCAVGSPGIGKSRTTVFLIKMLLDRGETVVYLRKTADKVGHYIKMTPTADLKSVDIQLFPETKSEFEVITDEKIYFVIDPQETDFSANPPNDLNCKVIINASPDCRHWGGNEFNKARDGDDGGIFLYYPLWSLPELQAARPFINPAIKPKMVTERFHEFGGVPRTVFGKDDRVEDAKSQRDNDITLLSDKHVVLIANNLVAFVDSFDSAQPKSSVMGYFSNFPFTSKTRKVMIISDVAQELVWTQYLHLLWNQMLVADDASMAGLAFEAFVRRCLLSRSSFTCRNVMGKIEFKALESAAEGQDAKKKRASTAVGKSIDASGNSTIGPTVVEGGAKAADPDMAAMSHEFSQDLPCLTETRLVDDIWTAVRDGSDGIIYYSLDKQYPLADCAFKKDGQYYAVQTTVGKSHDSKVAMIDDAVKVLQIKEEEKLQLFYAVPSEHFNSFLTRPVKPVHKNCSIMIMSIPRPTSEDRRSQSKK